MMTTQAPSDVAAQHTNAIRKAESEHIVVGRADKMAGMVAEMELDVDVENVRDGLQEMFKEQIDLYVTVNMSKVQDGDDPEEHTYFVLVNRRTEEVIQSSDTHGLFRLTHENSNHEDKATGSKHEVAVATDLGYTTPDRSHI